MSRITKGNSLQELRGIWALLPTPFNADLSLDLAGLRDNVRLLASHGVRIMCVACGVGEAWALSPEESEAIVSATREELGDRGVVVAGIGPVVTGAAIDFARRYQRRGADLLMIMSPTYPKPSDDEVVEHYRAIARQTSLPIQAYPVEATGARSMECISALIAIENVVSIKDVMLNPSYGYELCERFGDQIAIIPGRRGETELRQVFYHLLGCPGYYSNIVNWAPEIALEHWHALEAGNYTAVRDICRRLQPYGEVYTDMYLEGGGTYRYKVVQTIKEAMTLAGRPAGPVRPPLSPLTPSERAEIRQAVERVGSVASAVLA